MFVRVAVALGAFGLVSRTGFQQHELNNMFAEFHTVLMLNIAFAEHFAPYGVTLQGFPGFGNMVVQDPLLVDSSSVGQPACRFNSRVLVRWPMGDIAGEAIANTHENLI